MAGFVLRRLLWTVPVLLAVFTITFFMLRAIGGNPFRHGPLLGQGTPVWAKYNDPQPDSIVRRHVLRNSLVPVVTAAGPLLGFSSRGRS